MIIDEVWSVYAIQKVPDPKLNRKIGNKTKKRISDDENIKYSQGMLQGGPKNFPENDQ